MFRRKGLKLKLKVPPDVLRLQIEVLHDAFVLCSALLYLIEGSIFGAVCLYWSSPPLLGFSHGLIFSNLLISCLVARSGAVDAPIELPDSNPMESEPFYAGSIRTGALVHQRAILLAEKKRSESLSHDARSEDGATWGSGKVSSMRRTVPWTVEFAGWYQSQERLKKIVEWYHGTSLHSDWDLKITWSRCCRRSCLSRAPDSGIQRVSLAFDQVATVRSIQVIHVDCLYSQKAGHRLCMMKGGWSLVDSKGPLSHKF